MNVPAWLAGITVEQIVALFVGLSVIGFFGQKVWRGLRKIFRFIDDMNGSPARPGVREQPGVMARLSSIEDSQKSMAGQVQVIHHEVLPNGGNSLRDELTALTERVDEIEKRLPPEENS